jgi:dihydrofolate reductase
MSINLIACIDLNSAIGYKNQLLTKLPNDLKRFKELTINNFIVMGSRTFESIGKPLPNRHNIIVSRNVKYPAPSNTYLYNSLESVIFEYKEYNENENELCIIGGSDIYKQALEYADKLYITIVDHCFTNADSYFPKFDISEWEVIDHEQHKMDDKHLYNYHFVTYARKNKNK